MLGTVRVLQGLLKRTFDYAMNHADWRPEGANPAEWRGRLAHDPKLKWMQEDDSRSQPAMRWQDLPAFYPLLIAKDTMSARALRLQILGVLRPHNAIEVLHREINKRTPGAFEVTMRFRRNCWQNGMRCRMGQQAGATRRVKTG
jgi:hypothetical protein